jgi:predicted dehydrogenase
MKFLIAGFGSIGRRHFRNLKAVGEKDVLFYRSGKGAQDSELKGQIEERNMNAALAHKPDAVIVANPTALHMQIALPAAEAGCHILLEKPISHNLDDVQKLQTVAKKSGSRILVGFQFRFHPTLQQAAKIVGSGQLGKPLSARAHWGEYLPNWHPEEDYRKGYSARADLGGGVVLTLSHPFDYLRWFLGDAQQVWGLTSRSSELFLDVEDQAEIGLQFTKGVLASIHLDYWQRPTAHWLEIVCTGGVLHWNAHTGLLRIQDAQCNSEQESLPPAGFERNDMFLDEMRHFIEVVKGDAEPECTLQDGQRALEIALAALRSASIGTLVAL